MWRGLCLFFPLLLIYGCGGDGCKYPDEVVAGGIWESTEVSTVRPLNRDVIKQENQFGGYVIMPGVSENIARKNLWTEMRYASGRDVILQAGNKMKVSVDNSIVLSGFNQSIDATLGNWLPLDGSIITSPVGRYASHDFSDTQPSVVRASILFKQNGLITSKYTYTVADEGNDYDVDPDDSNSGLITSAASACEQRIDATDAINYIFYFPDHITFVKLPVADVYISGNDPNPSVAYPVHYINNVTVYASGNRDNQPGNNLTCKVERNGALYYVCTFNIRVPVKTYGTLNGKNLVSQTEEVDKIYEYRRLITPAYDGKYASFEEQINSLSEEVEYEDNSDKPGCNDCDSARIEGPDCDVSNASDGGEACLTADKNAKSGDYQKVADCAKCVGTESANSKEHRYLLCIQGGNGQGCANHKVDGVYDHIEHIDNGKSPIKVFFKNFSQILSGKSTKRYNFDQCFLKPKSFRIKETTKTINGSDDNERSQDITYLEYRSRYLSDKNEIVCNDDGNTRIYHPGNCRAVPKRIKYHLHNVGLWNHECLDLCKTHFAKSSNPKVDFCTCDCCDHCCNGEYSKILSRFQDYVMFKTDVDLEGSTVFMEDGKEKETSYHHNTNTQSSVVQGYHDVVDTACNNGKIMAAVKADMSAGNNSDIDAYDALITTGDIGSSFVIAQVASTSPCSQRKDEKNSKGEIFDDNSRARESGYQQLGSLLFHPYDPATGHRMGLFRQIAGENEFKIKHPVCYETSDLSRSMHREEKDSGANQEQGAEGEIDNPTVVAWIDYRKKLDIDTLWRKSANYNDPNNSFYYDLSGEVGSQVINAGVQDGYVPLEQGLLPIGSPEIEEIECFDGELPQEYYEVYSIKTQKPEGFDESKLNSEHITTAQKRQILDAFMDDGCKISGSYKTYEVDTEMRFQKRTAGIIPIQWSAASFKTGVSIPVTITTKYPIKVKANGCEDDTDDCYVELTGGNGLAVYIMPNEDNMAPGSEYVDPDLWQCNMGMGGSHNKYRPYRYKSTMVKNRYNPRRIETSSNLWWTCDDERTMWASGYDFINVKTGKPIYYHMYDESDLLYFLPAYTPSTETPEKTVDEVGCNSSGLPSSMIIGGKKVAGSNILGIVYDSFAGACYKYRSGDEEKTIGIYDASITEKVYEKFKPVFILVDLTQQLGEQYDEVTITNTSLSLGGNNLERIQEGIKAYYTFTYNGKDYKIPIEDERITAASCYAEGQEPATSVLSEENLITDPGSYSVITDYTFEENSKFYKYNRENGRIFTRYGPFTGFAENTTSLLSPAIFQTEGACFGLFEKIPTRDPTDMVSAGQHADGAINVDMSGKQFIYDEQHGDTNDNNGENKSVATYMGYPNTNTTRNNLSDSWRIEFTTPALESQQTDDNNGATGTNSRCIADVEALTCSEADEPDIAIVDLSKTLEANTNTDIKGTVFLYKEKNGIRLFNKSYYEITSMELGWSSAVEYSVNDPSKESITCNGKSNCGIDEIPVIKLTKNGEHHTLVNGENATISQRKSKTYYTFDYQLKNYTIKQADVDLKNTICFATTATNCPSYLKTYITGATKLSQYYYGVEQQKVNWMVWEHNKDEYKYYDNYLSPSVDGKAAGIALATGAGAIASGFLTEVVLKKAHYRSPNIFTMGKAPYFLACSGGQNKELYETQNLPAYPEYRFPYALQEAYSTKSEKDMLDVLDDFTFVDNEPDVGFALQSNIKDFVSKPTFARCVSSWFTPSWMLMQQPGDPSTFNTGFSAISGNYFAPAGEAWSKQSVMDRYNILPVWRTYGGMVNNTVVNQNCQTKAVNGLNVGQSCVPSSSESFTAEFRTLFDKQLIFVKSLINDPINTNDGVCKIYTSSSDADFASVTMNEPFGTVYNTSAVKSIKVDKVQKSDDVPGVQSIKTINGDGKHGEEFFKKTEMYRNWIGAGVIHPGWHVIRKDDGVARLFDAGEQIHFRGTGSYYVAGNLSHQAQGYCVVSGSVAEIGRESLWATALALNGVGGGLIVSGLTHFIPTGWVEVLAGLTLIFGAAPGAVYGALAVSNKSSGGANTKGKMTVEKPDYAKRNCPTGVAFRVVPIPPFVCKSGYNVSCSNERINAKAEASSNNIKTRKANLEKWCKSEEQTDFQSESIPIGRCYKTKYNILSGDVEGSAITMRYNNADRKLLNSLVELPSESLLFTESENVYGQQCGLCVKSAQVYTYNGVTFVVDGIGDVPDDVRTDEHCRQYVDNSGEAHKFVTRVALLTSFDGYATNIQNNIKKNVSTRFKDALNSCDAENTYSPPYASTENANKIKKAFLKASIRDTASCTSIIMGLYQKFISEANTSPSCQEELSNAIELKANAVCGEMLAQIEAQDGKTYDRYVFERNGVSGVCGDKKDGVNGEPEEAPLSKLKSLTRIDQTDIVQKYGYGELTDGHVYGTTEPATFTISLPKKIRGKEYKTAKVGFAFAGTDDADVTKLYKDYRIGNLDDLKRGYVITIGNAQLIVKGKYLYYYIQPLNDNGVPDPNYDPNVILGADKLSYSEIVSDPRVYSYKNADVTDSGNAMITIPRTGKLWWAILDHTGVQANDVPEVITSEPDAVNNSGGAGDSTTATMALSKSFAEKNRKYYAGSDVNYENKYITNLNLQDNLENAQDDLSKKKPLFAVVNENEGHDGDSDGAVIEFNDDNSDGLLTTTDDNYMSVNSGSYWVKAKIQTEKADHIATIGGEDNDDDSVYWTHTLFTKLIIKPLKTIFMGAYQCRYCEKKNLANCVDYSVKEPEGLKAYFTALPDYGYKEYSVDDYTRYCDYRWENGLIGQLATSFLKSPVLYYFWFVFVVLSVFVIGWGFITGSQKFDFKFMKKYLWRYALIMAFVNPQSWDLYLRLFVKPAFNLAEGLSAIVANNFTSRTYNDASPIGFTSTAFGPVDDIFNFWFSVSTLEKMLAILFSSWAGWLAVVLLLVCLVFFVISVLEAVVLYVVILLKMSLYLAIGPIVFLLLIHEKTASKFTDWWKIIAGLIAEQVTMFTAIAVFCTIYYHVLKGSMNFVYCWEPVLKVPILNITLLSMWRISGTLPAHMAELMGSAGDDTAINSKGFNIITGFILFIITSLMSKFVDKASGFGASLFGQQGSMPQEIKQMAGQFKSKVQDIGKTAATAPYKFVGKKIGDKLTGSGGQKRDSATGGTVGDGK